MLPMKRHLFTFVASLSLLFCLATLASWLFAPKRQDFRFHTSTHRYELVQFESAIRLQIMAGTLRADGSFKAPPGQRWDSTFTMLKPLPLGFSYARSPSHDPRAAGYFALYIPQWSLLLLFALLPLLWTLLTLRRLRLHKRLASHHCKNCGYDLRASKDRCPECGTPIPPTFLQRLLASLSLCHSRPSPRATGRRYPADLCPSPRQTAQVVPTNS